MTDIGMGNERSLITSKRPSLLANASSSSFVVMYSMRGCSASTRRGVKALTIAERSLVWSGGSIPPSHRWKMRATGLKASGISAFRPTVAGLLA